MCALGLENAAEYAKGATSFSDVPATHWAAGFINVASDQGLIKGFDPDDGGSLDEADIDADGNRLFDYRVTSACKIVDTGEWEVVPWASLEDATFDSACDNTALYTGGDASIEYCIFDSTGHDVAYDIAVADVGVVLSRKVTADGVAVKGLVEDETATYQVAEVDPNDSLEDSNEGTDTGTWSDIDIGDLVQFEFEADEFTDLDEPYADDVFFGLYSYWVEDLNEGDQIVTVRDAEDPDLADTDDLLLDEECVIYDVTGAPVQGEFGDLAADQVIQAFDLDSDGLVDVIKIVE